MQFPESHECITCYAASPAEKKLTLPEGVRIISPQAFFRCPYVERIELPSTLKEIYWNAFEGCQALKEVCLPDSASWFSEDAFDECSVTSLVIPEHFRAMEHDRHKRRHSRDIFISRKENCFRNTLHLWTEWESRFDYDYEDLNPDYFPYTDWDDRDESSYYEMITGIPLRREISPFPLKDAVYTGLHFFSSLKELTCLSVSPENPFYAVHDNVLYDKAKQNLLAVPHGITEFTLSPECRSVRRAACHLSDVRNLEKIHVPAENHHFAAYNDALYNAALTVLYAVPQTKTDILFPETLRIITENSVTCPGMPKITVPETVTRIEKEAFLPDKEITILHKDRKFQVIPRFYASGEYYWQCMPDGNWLVLEVVHAESEQRCLSLFRKLQLPGQQDLICDLCEVYPESQEFREILLSLGKEMAETAVEKNDFSAMKKLLSLHGLTREDALAVLEFANSQQKYEMQMLLMQEISRLSAFNSSSLFL